MAKYDVVIAGSGLGGLLCGYLLSKEGYSVCILERHYQIGGCLQTFSRNNCIFDTGMHYIGSMDEGQSLNFLFRYFGLTQKLKLKRLDINAFDVVDILGDKYNYAQGFDNFTETMVEYFPKEREGIVKYVNKLKEIGQSLQSILEGSNQPNNGTANFEHFYTNAKNFIESVTDNYRLQNVLAGLNPLYAGKPESTPIYLHGVTNHTLIESSWRMVDGGSQIADILADGIRNNGGIITTKANVQEFVSGTDGNITHVLLENGDHVEGKIFISNITPAKTMEMTNSDLIRPIYKKRIYSLENTISIFSLYIVFKENTFPYLNQNYYKYNNENVWGLETYDHSKWPDGHMLYTPASSKSEQFAESMVAITYMKYEEVLKWEHTTVEKRGEDYKEFKRQKAELLLDRIELEYPGIRNKIKAYYTSSPLTYRDYTGTLEGSIYGIMKDCNNPLKTFILPRTKVPNLLMTGQNINLHGVLGVAMGALITCSELLGFDHILKKIKDAS